MVPLLQQRQRGIDLGGPGLGCKEAEARGLSVASPTLLENIVVRVMSWDVGACVGAAVSRAAEDGHRVVPRADLRIAADDAAEDEDKLAMLDDDEDSGGVAAAAGAAAGVVGARGHRRPGFWQPPPGLGNRGRPAGRPALPPPPGRVRRGKRGAVGTAGRQ